MNGEPALDVLNFSKDGLLYSFRYPVNFFVPTLNWTEVVVEYGVACYCIENVVINVLCFIVI